MNRSVKRRRARTPRSIYPISLERDYAARLKRRLRLAAQTAKRELEYLANLRADSEAGDERAVERILGSVRLAYFERFTEVEDQELTVEVAGRVEGYIERQIKRQVKTVMGVDPMPTRELRQRAMEFAQENVSLIRSVEEEFFSRLEGDIVLALRQGARWEQLSPIIQERYRVSGRRAELIARDQMGSLVSQVAQTKQQSAGAAHYIWRNSQDERVVGNPSGLYPKGNDRHGNHWEREGQKFSWSNPPHDGHPGEPINCRCTAEPVWEEEEDAEELDVREARSLLSVARDESENRSDFLQRIGEIINRDDPTDFDRQIPRPSAREIANILDDPRAPAKAREAVRLLRNRDIKIRYVDSDTLARYANEDDPQAVRGLAVGPDILIRNDIGAKLTTIAHELSHAVDHLLGLDYSERDGEAEAWVFESQIRRLHGQEALVTTKAEANEIYDAEYKGR